MSTVHRVIYRLLYRLFSAKSVKRGALLMAVLLLQPPPPPGPEAPFNAVSAFTAFLADWAGIIVGLVIAAAALIAIAGVALWQMQANIPALIKGETTLKDLSSEGGRFLYAAVWIGLIGGVVLAFGAILAGCAGFIETMNERITGVSPGG